MKKITRSRWNYPLSFSLEIPIAPAGKKKKKYIYCTPLVFNGVASQKRTWFMVRTIWKHLINIENKIFAGESWNIKCFFSLWEYEDAENINILYILFAIIFHVSVLNNNLLRSFMKWRKLNLCLRKVYLKVDIAVFFFEKLSMENFWQHPHVGPWWSLWQTLTAWDGSSKILT